MDWDDEERRAAREELGWDGCRLWGRCGGKRCRQGGDGWRTPVTLPSPSMRPQGLKVRDRALNTCPDKMKGRIWSAVRRWSDAREESRRTLPQAGHPSGQPAWLFAAFGVLDSEWQLITLAQREKAREKANRDRR